MLSKELNKMFGKAEVHVEIPFIKAKEMIDYAEQCRKYGQKRLKCFCLTPVNYEFVCAEYGYRDTKENYTILLVDFYKKLIPTGADLQLHVHLAQFPELLIKEEIESKIKDAYNFFITNLGLKPTEIIFGWYKYTDEAKKCAEELGLKIVEQKAHIYDKWLGEKHERTSQK